MSLHSSADDEYDSDEPLELQLDLAKLMDCASAALRAPCTSAKRLTRGSWHEIFILQFEERDPTDLGADAPAASLAQAGFSCIARLARVKGDRGKEESEIATISCLAEHTDLPVPEIYFWDLDPENDVGAAFVLMERLPGRHLHKIWDGLPYEHKEGVLAQIASVVATFASLKFDRIGSLGSGGLDPVFSPCWESPRGPFSSTAEFLQSYIPADLVESRELAELYSQIRNKVNASVGHGDVPAHLRPPFVMIHADFDGQNMLFSQPEYGSAPQLTGLIDFEFAYAGLRYFLYEYPLFIQDVSWSKHLYTENALLRSHFVRETYKQLPDPEERSVFISAMNGKSFALNGFQSSLMTMKCSEETLVELARYYLKDLNEDTGLAYSGRVDSTPEKYAETGEPLSNTRV